MKALSAPLPTGASSPAPAIAGLPPPLSAALQHLAVAAESGPLRLGDLLAVTQGRSYHLALILLALPFLTPVPMLGLSTVFGAAIALIGLRLAAGQPPAIPRRLLERSLPPRFAPTLLRASSRLVRWLERVLRPRWPQLHRWPGVPRVRGGVILLSGLMLLLPLPVPFSNFFPAAAIVLLAASALEDDGLFLLLGIFTSAFSAAFLTLVGIGGTAALQHLITHFPR